MKKLFLSLFLLTGCVTTTETLSVQQTDYVDYAIQYIDYNEHVNRKELTDILGVDPVKTEWCAAFVNTVLRENGLPTSNEYLVARSFMNWGTKVDEPQYGDLVIFSRGTESWQGHVGFYMGTEYDSNGNERYLVLGGNQRNGVNIKSYSTNRLIGIRRHAK